MENTIIIGAGMAGLTAAVYAARASLEPLLFTGKDLGGQIATTTDVENFPGFPQGITGPELYELFKEQAEKFGTRIELEIVTDVTFGPDYHTVQTENGVYEAKSIIVATGASPRKLGLPKEDELTGYGVSYCATCDGFFFRNKDVIVVGGGDSALQEGVFLSKFAKTVNIVHRRDQFRAGPALQERASKNDKINFIFDSVVKSIEGDKKVEGVTLENIKTGQTTEMPIDGVFIYIGHYPNTELFRGKLAMDDQGYLKIDANMMTSVPGVFAAGEVHDHIYRQAITSAGFGSMAAISTERYLAALEDRPARVETWA